MGVRPFIGTQNIDYHSDIIRGSLLVGSWEGPPSCLPLGADGVGFPSWTMGHAGACGEREEAHQNDMQPYQSVNFRITMSLSFSH